MLEGEEREGSKSWSIQVVQASYLYENECKALPKDHLVVKGKGQKGRKELLLETREVRAMHLKGGMYTEELEDRK